MKWLVLAVALVIGLLVSAVPVSVFMVRKGLENPDKDWAPGLVQAGVRMRMLFGHYEAAAGIWEQAARTWPQHPDAAKMVFRVALCHEQAKRHEAAVAWYDQYLAAYPQHMWAGQARRRMMHLKGSVD